MDHVRAIAALAVLGVLLAGCGGGTPAQPNVAGSGSQEDGTATRGDGSGGAAPGRIWFEVLGVSTSAPGIDLIELARDAAELGSLWDRYGLTDDRPVVSFDEHVVLFYGRAEDACPDELVALTWVADTLEATWVPPPGGCDQPLIATGYAVQLHRADLGTAPAFALRQHPGHGGDTVVTFELPAYAGPDSPPPPTVATQPEQDEIAALFDGHPARPCSEVDDPFRASLEASPTDPHGTVPPGQDLDLGAALQDYGAEHPDTFGFLFIDQSAGGVWTLGFTGDLEEHRAELTRRFPHAPLSLREAPFTQVELEEAAAPLREAMGSDRGPNLLAVGMVRVEVGVIDPTRETLDRLAELTDPTRICVSPEFSGVPVNG